MPLAALARFRAVVEYDGTDFLGFQRQASGRTVQAEFEAALSRLGWTGRSLLAAGRTDTGVHAAGQVVAFDLDWRHGDTDLLRALNSLLPADIAVQALRGAEPGFHPRYDARARRYRYTLCNRPLRSPLAARYAWQVWPALNLETLQAAGTRLLGRHDFAAFGTDPERGDSTTRTVSLAEWQAAPGGWFYFDIRAEAFLYHMVRSLVGALKRVGTGEMSLQDFEAVLASRDRARCPPLAPPQGLCLMEVLY
jgi:tRNA pseudouridine38-40 synthase